MSEKVNASITGRIIIRGQLVLEAPLLIGGGEGETDIAVVRDSQGNPYIPATALAGALRHYYSKHPPADVEQVMADYFWGSLKNDSRDIAKGTFQSAFYLDDLRTLDKIERVLRDGVAINEKGIAENQQKYDYEVVEPGAVFSLRADIILREGFDHNAFVKILGILRGALEQGTVTLGAMNAKGLGRVRLEGFTATEYDYTRKEHVLNWLDGKEGDDPKIDTIKPIIAEPEDFYLEAVFRIDHSLMVRSYSANLYEPDASQIKSGGIPILPGASLKGAIRARAGRILKTLGVGDRDSILMKNLLGWVEKKSGEKIKSRVIIRESIITDAASEAQSRMAIDRFTGGAMNGRLFDSMPVWSQKGKETGCEISIRVRNCEEWEAGLMMLVLKDLWNGDLPLGGEKSIGRGILRGEAATIRFRGAEYHFKTQYHEEKPVPKNIIFNRLEDRAAMEKWVTALKGVGRS